MLMELFLALFNSPPIEPVKSNTNITSALAGTEGILTERVWRTLWPGFKVALQVVRKPTFFPRRSNLNLLRQEESLMRPFLESLSELRFLKKGDEHFVVAKTTMRDCPSSLNQVLALKNRQPAPRPSKGQAGRIVVYTWSMDSWPLAWMKEKLPPKVQKAMVICCHFPIVLQQFSLQRDTTRTTKRFIIDNWNKELSWNVEKENARRVLTEEILSVTSFG